MSWKNYFGHFLSPKIKFYTSKHDFFLQNNVSKGVLQDTSGDLEFFGKGLEPLTKSGTTDVKHGWKIIFQSAIGVLFSKPILLFSRNFLSWGQKLALGLHHPGVSGLALRFITCIQNCTCYTCLNIGRRKKTKDA